MSFCTCLILSPFICLAGGVGPRKGKPDRYCSPCSAALNKPERLSSGFQWSLVRVHVYIEGTCTCVHPETFATCQVGYPHSNRLLYNYIGIFSHQHDHELRQIHQLFEQHLHMNGYIIDSKPHDLPGYYLKNLRIFGAKSQVLGHFPIFRMVISMLMSRGWRTDPRRLCWPTRFAAAHAWNPPGSFSHCAMPGIIGGI